MKKIKSNIAFASLGFFLAACSGSASHPCGESLSQSSGSDLQSSIVTFPSSSIGSDPQPSIVADSQPSIVSVPQPSSEATSVSPSPSYSSVYADSSSAYAGNSSSSSDQYVAVNIDDRVFFATGQANIDSSSRTVLEAQAERLIQNADIDLVIEGHADERGDYEYNMALGARRANAVRDFLISQGVDSTRLQTISFGNERPESLCSEESCWSKNRRAVLTPR